ncbi:hypothetical protein F5J12DRAFT_888789 [Pisolithus orientalis]|uniref:uncharacterized protein n=1 Tax=Pisolithus orientalis TaxID=936130 RepID=UPI0022242FF9|nr:uncharacterized protein F5J12DRAFT_888789 [Pisolithus orientalis]KAI6028267.1 hypothetical protein F5J12DRAFT_888789 [Pisolithus orientalis]
MDWNKEPDFPHVTSDSSTPAATTGESNDLPSADLLLAPNAIPPGSSSVHHVPPVHMPGGLTDDNDDDHVICCALNLLEGEREKALNVLLKAPSHSTLMCLKKALLVFLCSLKLPAPFVSGRLLDAEEASLVALCVAKLGRSEGAHETSDHPSYDGLSKLELALKLDDWWKKTGIVDNGNLVETHALKASKCQQQRKAKKTRVLSHTTLASIWEHMDRLSLPSWIAPVPWGVRINLLFTLGHLWGTKDPHSVEYKMFANFMDLVSATRLAMMHTMMSDHISKYKFYMKWYLQTLLDLYPGLCLAPAHHICLHLVELLQDFGPVHAWRCFPFERYNGMLQKIPTNGKHGEMEQTMLHHFCMGQHLWALLSSKSMPPEAMSLLLDFDHIFQTNMQGTLFNDMLSFDGSLDEVAQGANGSELDLKLLHKDDYHLLNEWLLRHTSDYDVTKGVRPYAYPRQSISWHGESFSVESKSPPNSCIIFQIDGGLAAGIIQCIFYHARTTTSGQKAAQMFFIVARYAGLSEELALANVYMAFPDAGIYCVSTSTLPDALLITSADVVCYFTSAIIPTNEVGHDILYVQSLDKVGITSVLLVL